MWKRSVSLRYLIESLLFLILLIVFQYEVSKFNVDLHLSIVEVTVYQSLQDELAAKTQTVKIHHENDDRHLNSEISSH